MSDEKLTACVNCRHREGVSCRAVSVHWFNWLLGEWKVRPKPCGEVNTCGRCEWFKPKGKRAR